MLKTCPDCSVPIPARRRLCDKDRTARERARARAKSSRYEPVRRTYALLGRPGTPLERFEVKFRIADDGSWCWIWHAASDKRGYGQFFVDGRLVKAHRWSFEYHRYPIPDGHELDHLCRRPACVNPDHLEPVTREENLRRQRQRAHV